VPYPQPLAALWQRLRSEGRAINLTLSETWTREIQVLPGRTHPVMTTSAASGYLLVGTTTAPASAKVAEARLRKTRTQLFPRAFPEDAAVAGAEPVPAETEPTPADADLVGVVEPAATEASNAEAMDADDGAVVEEEEEEKGDGESANKRARTM